MERAASAALDTAFELGKLLDCGLERESLSVILALLENGVNPEVRRLLPSTLEAIAGIMGGPSGPLPISQALAEVIKRLRQQAAQQQATAGAATAGGR